MSSNLTAPSYRAWLRDKHEVAPTHTPAIQLVKDPSVKRCKHLQEDFALEAGEAAALVVAREKRLPLGTDDGPTIKAAKLLGVPCVTAIHVLVELREKGRIDTDTALAKLERLQPKIS